MKLCFLGAPQNVGPSESLPSPLALHIEQGQQHLHGIAVGASPEPTSVESKKGSPTAPRSSRARDSHQGSKAPAREWLVGNSLLPLSPLQVVSSQILICSGTGAGHQSCPPSHVLALCLILTLLVGLKTTECSPIL